jgi:hypothetical protein
MDESSTPPIPAAAIPLSSEIMLMLSTAFPIHHQRVQGFDSPVGSGHETFSGEQEKSRTAGKMILNKVDFIIQFRINIDNIH